MSIFEKASKAKLRFTTPNGLITVEDLWDLPLEGKRLNLDEIAIGLHKQLEQTTQSFVSKKSNADKETQLKFDIVTHIINVKLEEKSKRIEAAEKAALREKLTEALAKKREESLSNKTEEELLAELSKLSE